MTVHCVWRCGGTMDAVGDVDHRAGCPAGRGGTPEEGEGWLRGVGLCNLGYGDNRARRCAWCGEELTGRRTRWCSDECSREFDQNHWWNATRYRALQRDGHRCRKCGRGSGNWVLLRAFIPRTQYDAVDAHVWEAWRWFTTAALEVNHIHPVLGRHAEAGCHHHLAGVETLCHACHAATTARQRRAGYFQKAPPEDAEQLVLVN